MTRLAVIIGEGHAASRATRQPPSLAAQSALSGALGLVHARLVSRDGRSLVELRNPLMATIVLPYLGQRAARRESRREPEHATARRNGSAAREDRAVGFRLTYRTMRVLAVIGDQPALSNRVVAEHAGISDAGQVSKLLARLTRLGLIENTGAGHTRGATNAWRLTREGEEFQRKIGRVSVYATTS
ncbi:MAG TPA: helix-turn-helix domain-containing protein [Solirubrobacteraceae bacterium]|nr:helix-turn-helix domain-containing protein [Solirubrobacteraceae bacterium]